VVAGEDGAGGLRYRVEDGQGEDEAVAAEGVREGSSDVADRMTGWRKGDG